MSSQDVFFDSLVAVEPDVRKYVVMKRSPAGNRQWLNKEGKYVLLRTHAARFSATEAAELLTGNAVMEVAP